MKLQVITPTADQPTGIALLEEFMAGQTIQPDEWIVMDDGNVPAMLTMGQRHIVRKRRHEGGASLAANILSAVEYLDGDIIAIMEHDDFYQKNHLETAVKRLKETNCWATGSYVQRYYYLPGRQFIIMRNIGSALCNTTFRGDLVLYLQDAAMRAFRAKAIGVDRLFWERIPKKFWDSNGTTTMVGIKGLPGRAGLGMGHRPNKKRNWMNDPKGEQLRKWVGDEYAKRYLEISS
ncbi:MAG: glycosyltransferase family A protein [Gammaproteobacteria bacterium]